MALKMNNFNKGVHWKIQFLGGGHEKLLYRGNCLKRDTVCRFNGGRLGKKMVGSGFEGVISQCTL